MNAGLVCDHRKDHVSNRMVYLTLEEKVRREAILTKCLAVKTNRCSYRMSDLLNALSECNGDSTCSLTVKKTPCW